MTFPQPLPTISRLEPETISTPPELDPIPSSEPVPEEPEPEPFPSPAPAPEPDPEPVPSPNSEPDLVPELDPSGAL